MCFSIQMENDMNKLGKRFGAQVSSSSQKNFENLLKTESELGPETIKQILGLKRKPSSPVFKTAKQDGRIYPGYFLPGLLNHGGERQLHYMRYRVRPSGSTEEIPSKYNVFNARSDSLLNRKTWKNLFLKKHALLPFKSFYEWVDHNGKTTLIRFFPEDRDIMWAPAVYDAWVSEDGRISFLSCAIITADPPKEILEKGHDRCPVFLKENLIDQWLNAENLNEKTAMELLNHLEPTNYLSEYID